MLFWTFVTFVTFLGIIHTIGRNITYDSRSLIIDGERILLLSGGMHYGRGTYNSWDHVMKLAKSMNLNTIQTYFMWNLHEPLKKGDLIWSENANITYFMELAAKNDLFVSLRIGPYVCGEWNFGGFPWWARDINNIAFRTYNEPFMNEMGRILQIAVDKIRPYLASNGGPIVMLQVENEYVYHPNQTFGEKYVEWAVETATNLTKNDPVPWIMCEHNPTMNTSKAIQTINGFWDEHQVDGTSQPSPKWITEHQSYFPSQPLWWTEDQAWFQGWGGGTLIRPVNQIANGILRWYALGGSYHNFYMLYGGNNFGRTAGKNVITGYANDAPINPFGIVNNPKYNKLQSVFGILSLYSSCLLSHSPPPPIIIQTNIEYITYSNTTNISITFLSNIGPLYVSNIHYKNQQFSLAANSTIVLDFNNNLLVNSTGNGLNTEQYPDCILPNSSSSLNTINISSSWLYWSETPGIGGRLNTTNSTSPIEMWNITSDQTEYIWYIPTDQAVQSFKPNIEYVLQFPNVGTFQYIYVYDISNGVLLAMSDLTTSSAIKFNANNYTVPNNEYSIGILIAAMGMDNGGYTQQTYTKGIVGKVLLNNNDISSSGWMSEGKLYGEYLELFNKESFDKVIWMNNINNGIGKTLTWWRSTFITPNNINPTEFESLAIDLNGAIKGFIYVNGYNLGRYWMIPSICKGQPHSHPDITMQWDNTYCNQHLPLQRYYSLPTDYLNPSGESNDIVIIEEVGMVNPKDITIVFCESV